MNLTYRNSFIHEIRTTKWKKKKKKACQERPRFDLEMEMSLRCLLDILIQMSNTNDIHVGNSEVENREINNLLLVFKYIVV